MCKFCYRIGEENSEKKITWSVRSCYADQNVEDYNELPSEWDGKHRQIERECFSLVPYKRDNNVYISVEYRMETDDNLIINPFSVLIPFSFCPFCGEQLSQDIKLAQDLYQHELDIEDSDWWEGM